MKGQDVTEKIYAVGGPGLSSPEDAYVYLIDAGSELVLIDAGVGLSIDRIERNIKSLGLEPARIWHAIATHCHIDHAGGLAFLVERYGTKVVAHQMDQDALEGKEDDRTAASMYGVKYRPVKVDIALKGGLETLGIGDKEFFCLHTPGHTPGSISVYLDTPEGRVLFGQDVHGPFSKAWGSDLGQWRKAMENLLSLKADILCEGHAGVYKGKEKVRNYIESYLERYSSTD